MTHKLLILTTVLMLVGCAGKTRTNDFVPFTVEELAAGITEDDDGRITATPEMLSRVNVARYKEFGLVDIRSLDPFVVNANEKIILKNPEAADRELNVIRFDGWGEKEWLSNNYIRTVRLYIDAHYLGLVKNEEFDKYKSAMRGKFTVFHIQPYTSGGADISIMFVDEPSFMLRFWVYSFVGDGISGYDVRAAFVAEPSTGVTAERMKEILKNNPQNTFW